MILIILVCLFANAQFEFFFFAAIVISLVGNHLHSYTNLITRHQSKITLNSSLNQNVTRDHGNPCCLEKKKT